ncbi:hypothetical protein GALL_475570 [mine drainage metagenome]|uniref:Uncharacterized protein n=1 Tax=mine drainage metagenome TaxID=410659 RepID=A0A1J5PZZ8_9ZZZZ
MNTNKVMICALFRTWSISGVPRAWKIISSESSLRNTPNSSGRPSTSGSPNHQTVSGASAALIRPSAPKCPSSANTTLPPTSSGVTMVSTSLERAQVSRSMVRQLGHL